MSISNDSSNLRLLEAIASVHSDEDADGFAVVAALLEGFVFLAVREPPLVGLRAVGIPVTILTTRGADGGRVLPVFTSVAEARARRAEVAVIAMSGADAATQVLDGDFSGLQINPAGQSYEVDRQSLESAWLEVLAATVDSNGKTS